jgi:hypothetical protein
VKRTYICLLLTLITGPVMAEVIVGDVQFAWDGVSQADAYKVYCDDVVVYDGPETQTPEITLTKGRHNCWATAYMDFGEGDVLESGHSNVLTFPFSPSALVAPVLEMVTD